MLKKSPIILLLCCCLFTYNSLAQSYKQNRRFKAGLLLGTTFAQIDGDKHSGYSKGGLQGGLRGVAIFTDEIELSFELLFTQKGSKSKDVSETARRLGVRKPLNMRLNYMEVPIMLNYRFDEVDKLFYKFEIHGGLAYSRLLEYKITEINARVEGETIFNEIAKEFQRNDLSLVLGGKVNVSPNLGFILRHTVALNRFYYQPDATGIQIEVLRNYFFSLLASYSF
jgi:hypothetical protein